MGKPREDHSNGVVGRQRELRLSNVRFKLLNNGGKNRVRKTVKRSPLGIAKRGFHCPNVFSGESSEGGDGEFSTGSGGGGFSGGGRFRVFLFGIFSGWIGGDVGKNSGDCEEKEWSGGGGGKERGGGGGGGGVGGRGGGEIGEEGRGGIQVVVELQ